MGVAARAGRALAALGVLMLAVSGVFYAAASGGLFRTTYTYMFSSGGSVFLGPETPFNYTKVVEPREECVEAAESEGSAESVFTVKVVIEESDVPLAYRFVDESTGRVVVEGLVPPARRVELPTLTLRPGERVRVEVYNATPITDQYRVSIQLLQNCTVVVDHGPVYAGAARGVALLGAVLLAVGAALVWRGSGEEVIPRPTPPGTPSTP